MKRFIDSLSIKALMLFTALMCVVPLAHAQNGFDPNPPADPQFHYYYPITVTVSPANAGWASGGGEYEAGSNIWINTSASSGYAFSHWEKDGEIYSDARSFYFTTDDKKHSFVAVYEYSPTTPADPDNTYEPKKRLYLTCNSTGCSFNLTSGEKRLVGKNIGIQAYINNGYKINGWYEGDSLVATTSGFTYMMPDHDVTLRLDIEYAPSLPDDPVQDVGDIVIVSKSLDDINPFIANPLFYFEKTEYTYTGKPLALGYYSRLNPIVEPLDELATEVGTYSARIDVQIQNDSINTHRVFNYEYSIVPAELIVSTGDYTKVYGMDNPSFTIRYRGFVNGETDSVLTTVPTIATSAQKGSSVGEYAVEISRGEGKNYTVKTIHGSLTITKAPIVITPDDVEVTYGDEDMSSHIFSYSVDGFVNGDTVDCFTANPVIRIDGGGTDAGSYSLYASGAVAQNYDISYKPGTLTINKGQLTVTVNDTVKLYGATNPALTFKVTDAYGRNKLSELLTMPTLKTDVNVLSNVGSYPIIATGATSKNYVITVVNGQMTVKKAPLIITPKDVTVRYGADMTDYGYDFRYSGFMNGDYVSSLTTKPVVTILGDTLNVGTYSLIASGAEAANYDISYEPGTLTVARSVLTITVGDTARTYGDENPAFTYTVVDSLGNDCMSGLTVLPTLVTEATVSSGIGVYDITAVGAESRNYTISVVDGHLTVTKAPLVIIPNDIEFTFGDDISDYPLSFIAEGFVNGDSINNLVTQPRITVPDSIPSIGNYEILADGAQAINYSISYQPGTLTVSKGQMIITVNDTSKVYGSENPAFSYTAVNSQGNDCQSWLTVQPTFVTDATASSGTGVYEITATGAESQNYFITVVNGHLTINKAVLSIIAKDASRLYGDENPEFGYVVTDSSGTEMDTLLVGVKPVVDCAATVESGVGKYEIVAEVEFDSINYSINVFNGKLTILPDTLIVTADDIECFKDSSEFSFSYHIEGFKNSDNDSVLTKKPVIECDVTEQSEYGTYIIKVSGAEADNYVFVYVNGTLTLLETSVRPIVSDGTDKVYDILGRVVGTTADELNPGMYIINNRKIIVR